jgi:N-methylhydantoinase B
MPAYTHAYATFVVRLTLNQDLLNNAGSLAPIKIILPDKCVVDTKYPSPVNTHHIVSMYVSFPILKALSHVAPDRIVAKGSGAVWTIQIQGKDSNRQPFTSSIFNYSGGMGARANKPGLSAICYPTGVSAVPVKVLEASYPIVFTCKELEHSTGGKGKQPGGKDSVSAITCAPTRPGS